MPHQSENVACKIYRKGVRDELEKVAGMPRTIGKIKRHANATYKEQIRREEKGMEKGDYSKRR